MALITRKTMEEGELFNKWLESRLIKQNKNVLSAELGSTGSGKSYRDLRKAELWYKYYFKEQFPEENITFGIPNAMKILASGKLRKGDVIIVEEAGVNLGSRGWQSKLSQMFNYILQSFRSMNIALFFNLPYLSMLDSQARHLLHYYAESAGVDYKKGLNKCKPFFVQVAQASGKVYRHYPKVKVNGRTKKVKRFTYSLPSQYLIDAYEGKKEKYLKELVKGYSDKVNEEEKKPDMPKDIEFEVYNLYKIGKSQREIAEIYGIAQQTVSSYVINVRKWYERVKNKEKERGVVGIPLKIPIYSA